MGEIRWIILSAIAILSVHAAPRELNSEELITEPRPGEEYVNIQTGGPAPPLTQHQKVDLQENSFSTSHRISQPKPKFQTAHKIQPKDETNHHKDGLETSASELEPAYYDDDEEATTPQATVEVVTRTSVKMSKSKKVQKPVVKSAHEVKLDIKSSEGVIDERENADEEEKKIMEKKFSTEAPKVEKKKFIKLNVPFEDDETEEETVATTTKAPHTTTTPESTTITLTTTDEPLITTFNYKNIYDKSKKAKEVIEIIPEGKENIKQEKYKYETVANESLKTAESRTSKKETKQEKKDKHHEILKKEDVGFDVVHINSRGEKKLKEDNFDFFDADEKVLVPAGSSPGQSSRINIKKGPNGQDYEYEYVYYYYDEDEEGANGTVNLKEGKVVASTTERVFNGHDGPAVDEKFHTVPQTSTNGNKYLPTEAPKTTPKSRAKPEYITVEEEVDEEITHTRGGSNGNGNRYSNINRHVEPVNNEVLPATSRPTTRSRGRINIPGAHPVPVEEIPTIADERLPANTRFPPRSRSNNVATSPQPQETTTRTRSRDNSQNRVRLPTLGLLDSSSFRTHASDASIDEDPIYETELQRRPPTRTQTTTETKYEDTPRRGTRPTTVSTTTSESYEEEVVSSRRPASRKPDERTRPKVYEEEEERYEKISGNGRRPETTRESDAEEVQGQFEVTKTPYTSISRPSTELRGNDITTENQSIVGLTSAMMNKVALDLYAILQQTQNENIRTNFVDANSTDVTTDSEEVSTEYSTTTTSEAPTTTTTTTTQAPQPTGRGRYKTRGGNGVNISKTRTRVSSAASSTTEPATETSSSTSSRTRGRFHPSNSNRVSGQTAIRRTSPKPRTEEVQEDSVVKEEAQKQNSEKSFGERPSRNRYRAGSRVSTSTTSAPSVSAASPSAGSRSSSLDRYNTRRRGSNRVSSTTHQPSTDEGSDEADTHHEASRVTEDTSATTPAIKPSRARLPATGARPLRPGPRVPLSQLTQRGRSSTTTTQAPLEPEEIEREQEHVSEEQHVPQVVEEVQEQPTTPADALTRLRNRPRLHINQSAAKRQTTTTQAPARKKLPSLLSKRKQTEEKAAEKIDENVEDEKTQEEIASEEEQAASPSTQSTSTTAEPETKGLSGLLAGRRRTLNRKPGTLYSRTQSTQNSES